MGGGKTDTSLRDQPETNEACSCSSSSSSSTVSAGSGNGLVKVAVTPDTPYVVNGVLNTKQVLLDIITPPVPEGAKRPPLNLCVVLDRSGSMSSDSKLTFAKEAIVSVLNLLRNDDLFHLVTYESTVKVELENVFAGTRDACIPIVQALTTAGCTNLHDGVKTGGELIEKHKRQGYSNRMFLFSDGLANQGIQSKPEIFKLVTDIHDKLSLKIDSFGIGADFDSEMMRGIAEHGHSEFFYLENATVIQPLVVKALQSVTETIGSNGQLILRGKNGAIVTKIFGRDSPVNAVSLGDLHFDNSRRILCEITVPGASEGEEKGKGKEKEEVVSTVFLHFELTYAPVGQEQSQVEPVRISEDLSFTFTDDESLVKQIHPKVEVYAAIQKSTDIDKAILKLVEAGKVEQAKKEQIEQIEYLKKFIAIDDEHKIIELLVKLAEQSLEKLKLRGDRKDEMEKEYSHKVYMKGHGSYKYYGHYS